MQQNNAVELVGNFNESTFNTVSHYFDKVDDYFADFFNKKTISSSAFNLNHVTYDDLYWSSAYVDCDHSGNGILHLDFVYPPKGSEWDGCPEVWDFDGVSSVEGLIGVSTNVRGADVIEIKGAFDENASVFNVNEYFLHSDEEMDEKSINSSSFTQYNNNLTVNMVKRSVSDSSMTERMINA